ncbi:MAG: asparagine synthase (glutamine-hydrolyzing) [Deltaproteobacteria bacterium]|nr:asparagine synthase (glutamine-hydrolyzing) [Deltaproteobacteria bacterium]
MCGICGFAGFSSDGLLDRMCRSLAHRGPDEEGTLIDRENEVYLGHTRLSIIDLSSGTQPIYNETGTIAVVFNGEIYNFMDLRLDLIDRGHQFKTNSDTEVLVHLYEEYGLDMPRRLNGIFSFVIYDQAQGRLFGVRDYFGVKPFFYYHQDGRLLFGSEMKAILCDPEVPRQVNFEAMHYSLNLRFIPGELSLLDNIRRLPAGCFLLYDTRARTLTVKKYWNETYEVNHSMTEDEAVEGIRFYLRQAVKRQLISDVPLGAYLSGGLDSSAVVAYASEFINGVNTFSMGFDEPTDEVDDARRVSDHFQTRFHQTFLKINPLESLKEVLWHVEEPKINVIQGYFLSNFARRHVKVALSGLGGDELFAGYVNNHYLSPFQFLHTIMPRNRLFEFLSSLTFYCGNKIGNLKVDEFRRGLQMGFSYGHKTKFYSILRNVWDYDPAFYTNVYSPELVDRMLNFKTGRLFEKYFANRWESIVAQSLRAEFETKMVDDFLLNEDRTSMANALEVRVPFLDRDLVAFAFSIPLRLKMKHNTLKYIYKKAMTGVLPDFVLHKKKWGFAINPYYQFQKDLKQVAIDVLNEKKLKEQGIFNYKYVEKIIHHSISPRLRWHYYYLWQLVGFQYWYDLFIDGKH